MTYYQWSCLWEAAERKGWVDAIGGVEYTYCFVEWVEMDMPLLSMEDLANWVNARVPKGGA